MAGELEAGENIPHHQLLILFCGPSERINHLQTHLQEQHFDSQ
jgi:hypothetical protein